MEMPKLGEPHHHLQKLLGSRVGEERLSPSPWDPMGMPPNEFTGQFEGDVLSLSNRSPRGHSRAVFDGGEPARYVFRLGMSPDGSQWQTLMEGRYSRRG